MILVPAEPIVLLTLAAPYMAYAIYGKHRASALQADRAGPLYPCVKITEKIFALGIYRNVYLFTVKFLQITLLIYHKKLYRKVLI